MFHLILSACLVDQPQVCAPRMLPAGDSDSRGECLQNGPAIALDWIARHADLRGSSTNCVETAALPALEAREIAPGVWFHQGAAGQLSPQNRGQIANMGFVIGDSVAVIDAGGSRAEGEQLYIAIRKVTSAPISHVILTHMHPDHILGAEVFSEAGAAVVANARLPDAVARRRASWMISIPQQIGAEAFAGSAFAAVDQLIEAPATIPLGKRELVLTPAPVAHTDNDLTVLDRASGVMFTGDLVFQGLTPAIDGSLSGWLDWLALAPFPRTRLFVPGHGPLQTSWPEAIHPEVTYLQGLHDTTRKAIDAGMPLSQAIPAIVTMMKPLSDGWADFAAITARNAATAYTELEWQ